MLKKAMVLAVAVAALAALAVPTTASAQWTKEHQDIQSNQLGQVHGTLKFQGQVGSVECAVTTQGLLIAGTTTAEMGEFHIDAANATAACSIGGGLITTGCTDVSSVAPVGLPWGAHATGTTQIQITSGTINFAMHGGALCTKQVQLTPGTIVINTVSDTFAAAQLSGLIQAHVMGKGSQQVTVSGQGTVTPEGSFGVT